MSRAPVWAVFVGTSLAAGAVIGRQEISAARVWLALLGMTVLLLAIVIGMARSERDLLSPLAIVTFVGMVLYVLRPIYILQNGSYGPTRAVEDRPVTGATHGLMAQALLLAILCFAALAIGYLTVNRERVVGSGHRLGTRTSTPVSLGGVLLIAAPALALAGIGYWRLIGEVGGLHAYVQALSLRSDFFFGRAYLTMLSLPLKAAALCVAALIFAQPRVTTRQLVVLLGLLGPVAVTDFLSGGRAALLLGTMLPVVVIFHHVRSPVRLPLLIGILGVAMLLFIGTRVVTRDAVYQGADSQRTSLVVSAVRGLPESTVGGREAIPFDSLMTLVEASNRGARLEWGRTYFSILTFPIPRAIWPGKPVGGGNVWFTKTYYPGYYANGRIETSISFVGETYANFGAAGVAALSFLVGVFIARLYRKLQTAASLRYVVVYAATLGYLITLLRGNAFHSVTGGVLTVACVMGVWPFLMRRACPASSRGVPETHTSSLAA